MIREWTWPCPCPRLILRNARQAFLERCAKPRGIVQTASRRAREGEGKVFTPYRWIATIRCKHLSSIALMNVIITVHANESFPITEFDVQIRTRRLYFKPFLFFRRGVSAFVDLWNTTVSQIESLCLEFLRGSMNLLPFFTVQRKRFLDNGNFSFIYRYVERLALRI